ncbi:MAG: PAS domain-containing protein, partial [Anaerolineales bacterium]
MNPDLLPALFQQSPSMMIMLDPAGQILAINPAAARLAGHAPAALVGRPFADLLDPFSHTKAAEMLRRARAEGQVADWELDQLCGPGAPVLVDYDATLLRDAAGQPSAIALVGHDLSAKMALTDQLAQTNQQFEGALLQLEKAHAQLQAAQAQLVQSEKMRALGQMVAGVAHEINNPAAFVASNLAHLARWLPALRALYEAYAALRPLGGPDQLAAVEAAEQAAEADYLW